MEAQSVQQIVDLAERPAKSLDEALICRESIVLYVFRVPNSRNICASLMKPLGKRISPVDIDNALYCYAAERTQLATLLRRDPFSQSHKAVARIKCKDFPGDDTCIDIINHAYTLFGRSTSGSANDEQDVFSTKIQSSPRGDFGDPHFSSPWKGDTCVFKEMDGNCYLRNQTSMSATFLSEFRVSLPIRMIGSGSHHRSNSSESAYDKHRSSLFQSLDQERRKSQLSTTDRLEMPPTAIDHEPAMPSTKTSALPNASPVLTIRRKAVGSSVQQVPTKPLTDTAMVIYDEKRPGEMNLRNDNVPKYIRDKHQIDDRLREPGHMLQEDFPRSNSTNRLPQTDLPIPTYNVSQNPTAPPSLEQTMTRRSIMGPRLPPRPSSLPAAATNTTERGTRKPDLPPRSSLPPRPPLPARPSASETISRPPTGPRTTTSDTNSMRKRMSNMSRPSFTSIQSFNDENHNPRNIEHFTDKFGTASKRLSNFGRSAYSSLEESVEKVHSPANRALNRTKLGKLILHDAGQGLMDLVVAANLALFQQGLEEMERRVDGGRH